MDFSKISYGQVRDYSNKLKTASQSMNELLTAVKTEFDKLGNDGVWSGDAATQVKSEFDELSAKFPEFYTAIQDCARYLDSVVANYEGLDATVKNIQI